MEIADLVFLDSRGEIMERVAGFLSHEDGLAWRPGVQCEFERDALAPLFAALERMRRERRLVGVEVAREVRRHAIREVDGRRQLLFLTGSDEAPALRREDGA